MESGNKNVDYAISSNFKHVANVLNLKIKKKLKLEPQWKWKVLERILVDIVLSHEGMSSL